MIFALPCSVSVRMPGLRSGERHRRQAEILDGHAQQRHRDALAGGEQHVHLASARRGGDVVRQADEIVGGLAHRRDDHDHVVAASPRPRDMIRHCADAIGVGDRGAAELLHDQCHGLPRYRADAAIPDEFPAESYGFAPRRPVLRRVRRLANLRPCPVQTSELGRRRTRGWHARRARPR